MNYNQYCPISKACEILGERWTILIVREFLNGATRFSELQRGLGGISPALLTQRLASLEAHGLIVKRRIQGQRGFEYHPTEACKALLPVLFSLGEWGIIYARHTVLDTDFDPELLMLYLERSVDPTKLHGVETIIKFRFTDLSDHRDWWIVIDRDRAEVCLKDPGKDVAVYFNCTVRTMFEVWMGDRTYRDAMSAGDLIIEGEPALVRNVRSWLRGSDFETSPRPLAAAAPA